MTVESNLVEKLELEKRVDDLEKFVLVDTLFSSMN